MVLFQSSHFSSKDCENFSEKLQKLPFRFFYFFAANWMFKEAQWSFFSILKLQKSAAITDPLGKKVRFSRSTSLLSHFVRGQFRKNLKLKCSLRKHFVRDCPKYIADNLTVPKLPEEYRY